MLPGMFSDTVNYLVRDGETGFTIPDQEPEELCDKISWLLNDPQLRATMSQRAVEYAQDYAWEKIAKQIVVRVLS